MRSLNCEHPETCLRQRGGVKHVDMENDIREKVIKYSDMLYKICIVILCNEHDAQDVIQDTFCR